MCAKVELLSTCCNGSDYLYIKMEACSPAGTCTERNGSIVMKRFRVQEREMHAHPVEAGAQALQLLVRFRSSCFCCHHHGCAAALRSEIVYSECFHPKTLGKVAESVVVYWVCINAAVMRCGGWCNTPQDNKVLAAAYAAVLLVCWVCQ